MRNKFAMAAALAAMTAAPVVAPTPAFARHHHYHHKVYRGHGGDYRYRCRGGNGAVGTVAGGVGGAVLGSALGGGTLGTVAGGVGGALLGRHLDKQHTRHRHGC
ncbi:MAG TPA: glycine zipper 2TM domain-containing protein [Sphingomonas sp.]|nr:glycine zipper 2TM domain-containing protein [Sphingomonas sp.]